jgi:hypothetical protein
LGHDKGHGFVQELDNQENNGDMSRRLWASTNKMERVVARIGEFAAAHSCEGPRRAGINLSWAQVWAAALHRRRKLKQGGLRLVFKGGYLQR